VLNGKFVLHVAIGNLWTAQANIDELWRLVNSSI